MGILGELALQLDRDDKSDDVGANVWRLQTYRCHSAPKALWFNVGGRLDDARKATWN